jgi:Fe-S cluster biosynthesis and repair protein YggX
MTPPDRGPQELLPTTRIGRTEFLSADVGDKHVLMNVEKQAYIGLDRVGKNIWDRLEEPQTIASLCEKLLTAYDVSDRTVLERDVREFLDNLRLYGLVEVLS